MRAAGDGAHIEIADHGLGMSAERLAEENARLVRRERLDLVPTKVLGLFVVGTLARRWGVTVTLSRTPGGGVTSRIALPSALLLTMSPLAAESPRPSSPTAGERDAERRARPETRVGNAAEPAAVPAPEPRRALPTGALVGEDTHADRPAAGTGSHGTARPEHTEHTDHAGSGRTPSWAARRAAEAEGAGHDRNAPAPAEDDPPVPLPRRVPRRDQEETAPAERTTAAGTSARAASEGGHVPVRPGTSRPAPEEAHPSTGGTPVADTSAGGAGALSRRELAEPSSEDRAPLVPRPRGETSARAERDRPYVADGLGHGRESEARPSRPHGSDLPRGHDEAAPAAPPRRSDPLVPPAPGAAGPRRRRPNRRAAHGRCGAGCGGDPADHVRGHGRAAGRGAPAARRRRRRPFGARGVRGRRGAGQPRRALGRRGGSTYASLRVPHHFLSNPRATHDQKHLPEGAEQ